MKIEIESLMVSSKPNADITHYLENFIFKFLHGMFRKKNLHGNSKPRMVNTNNYSQNLSQDVLSFLEI